MFNVRRNSTNKFRGYASHKIAFEDVVIAILEKAVGLDVIEPVIRLSPSISPKVIAFKENGDIRICIDMRLAEKAILRENYPLPVFETFMTKLRGAKYFTRLDLKSAYHQLELDESNRNITTFGENSELMIFQPK